MIATYIQELLATNNRVIVPNYGAFLVRATSKSKDANTLKEKLKDIYFSPFLKFNDELLEKYIIKKEDITKDQAAQKITEFIDKVKKELDGEKPYEIADFGQFIADKQGKVQFIPLLKEEKEIPKKDIKTESKPTTHKTATKKTAETTIKAEPKKEETTQKEKTPVVTELKKETLSSGKDNTKEPILEEYKDQKEETKTSSKVESNESIYSYKKEKKSMNKGLIWSIAIGLPVAAIFIWALLNFSTVKKVIDKAKTKTEKVTQQKKVKTSKEKTIKVNTEKTIKETSAKSEIQETPQEQENKITQEQEPPQKKYYIIAGSFKNEKYAVSYMNKLKSEGYNAEKLTERNGMHAISFNSFSDKKKAIAEYKFLVQEKNLQAWILYF